MVPENCLSDQDQWSRQAFDLAEVMLVHIGITGEIQHINRKGEEVLGYFSGELIGRNWLENCIPVRERQQVRRVLDSFMRDRKDAAEHFENHVLRKDGAERLIKWRNAKLRDGNGRVVAAIASGDDVTDQRLSEARLRESESRFRATFEQAAVGMAHVGLDGSFLRFNEKLCELTGYGSEELRRLTFQDITHPDDLDADLALARALHAGEIPHYTMEKRYLRKDGTIVWANLTGSLVRNEQEDPEYFIAVVEDISRRKSAEALRADEELQRMALAAAGAGAWRWKSGGELIWSSEIYRFFGLDPAQPPLGNDEWLVRCVHPEDRILFNDAVEKARAGRVDFHIEFRLAEPSRRWLVSTGRFQVTEDGAPSQAFGIIFDVTAQREAEQRLRDSEERLRLAMAAGQIGVWEWNIRSGEVKWSENLLRLAGVAREEFDGTFEAFKALLHPEDRQRVELAIRNAMAEGAEYELEFRMVNSRGDVRWCATRAAILRDATGSPSRMLGVDMDITERKALQARQEQLVGELDHRVKNILTLVQVIARQTLESGAKLEDFQGRLKALADAQALLISTQWKSVDFAALVRQEMSAYPETQIRIDGDRHAIKARTAQTVALIVHELATNAAKYGALSTPEGLVDIAWWADPKDQTFLQIRWKETGGPPVSRPDARGFGTRLIEHGLAMEGGEAKLRFVPEGFQAELRVPVE